MYAGGMPIRALGFLLALTASLTAQCTSAACFGPPGVDPVVIQGMWQIASGANLDFGQRHVILQQGGMLVLNGPCSISAARVSAYSYSLIVGNLVPLSDLSITTVAAGVHDGSVLLEGDIYLNGWPSGLPGGQSAGSLTVNAGGAATVQSLDTRGGDSAIAGSVTVTAPSISIGSIVAGVQSSFGTASVITLTSTGPVVVGGITAWTSDHSTPSQVFITCQNYTQVNGIVAAPWSGSGVDAPGCLISIASSGTATINGLIQTSHFPGTHHGGSISVHAPQGITWVNAQGSVSGSRGGSLFLTSQAGDISVTGSLLVRTEGDEDNAGVMFLAAACQLDLMGLVDLRTAQTLSSQQPPLGSLQAGGQITIHSGSSVDSRNLAAGCTGVGGALALVACGIVIETSASLLSCGNDPIHGATVNFSFKDHLVNDGTVVGGAPPGGVNVTTRLPWSYALAGSGTISPAPVVFVNPAMLPCADALASVTATPAVSPGQVLTVSVASAPNKPLLVAASTTLTHLSLGPYGWTQVDVFNAYLLADQEAILGPTVPGATNSAGLWTLTLTTPSTPILSNVDVFFDVYVFDPAAPNGLFRQPPYATTHFN
jgi:hypothetical protein